MLEALRSGEIDALIDDELVLLVAAEDDPELRLAFSVPTQVPFAIGVSKGEADRLSALNQTLDQLIADGTVAKLWAEWDSLETISTESALNHILHHSQRGFRNRVSCEN